MRMFKMKQILILSVGLVFLSSATSCYASRQRHSLEQFDVSKLVVFAISPVRGDGTRFAYVMDSNRYIHHVEIGEYLGTAEGRVQEITDSELVIIELRKAGGTFKEVKVVLPLRK